MVLRSRNGRLLHLPRQVSTRRPMHLTARLVDGLPTLRTDQTLRRFRQLAGMAERRGLRTIAFAIMGNHIHWLVIPASRGALHDATRYVFSQLARWLNRGWGRRGRVFADRFFSTIGRSVKQAWNQLAYVLRNPWKAGHHPATVQGVDPFLGVDARLIGTHRFLRSVFGHAGPRLHGLLWRFTCERVPFVPLRIREQPCLPGLDLPVPPAGSRGTRRNNLRHRGPRPAPPATRATEGVLAARPRMREPTDRVAALDECRSRSRASPSAV